MKNRRFITVFLFSILLFTVSFSLGYRLMEGRIGKDKLETDSNDQGFKIVKEENRIGPNTLIEERTHYKECGDLIENTNKVKEKLVNMDKGEYETYLRKNHPDFRLISFSNHKIIIWREKDHLCKNHFIIGEEGGYIAIFIVDDNGNRVVNNVFEEYPISLLVEIDQEKIKNGIVVDSKEELYDILENFIT